MFTISSGFIGDFKLGDNVVYNLRILDTLYRSQASALPDDKHYFNKPIILLNVAITEALLSDFFFRMSNYTIEGVVGVSQDILDDIRDKTVDKFAVYIDVTGSKGFFGEHSNGFYDELHELRKLRNRVHIQNEDNYPPRDEGDGFTDDNMVLAEKVLEKIVKTMSQKHNRPTVERHVQNFKFPWPEHFPHFVTP